MGEGEAVGVGVGVGDGVGVAVGEAVGVAVGVGVRVRSSVGVSLLFARTTAPPIIAAVAINPIIMAGANPEFDLLLM